MGFKFGMDKSLWDGCEVLDKTNIEVTTDGRVVDIIEEIGDFS